MSATFPLTFCVAIVKAIKMWSLKKKMLKTNCYINRAMKLLQKKLHSSTYKNFQMCMISRTWKNMNVYTCSKLAGKKPQHKLRLQTLVYFANLLVLLKMDWKHSDWRDRKSEMYCGPSLPINRYVHWDPLPLRWDIWFKKN